MRRRWVMTLVAAVATAMTAGCAGLPISSAPHVVRTVVSQSVAPAPQGPSAGQQPAQVVREFIHAAGRTDYDSAGTSFLAARQFLTASAQESWHANTSTTPVVVLADDFSAATDSDDSGVVMVTGREMGRLVSDRSYQVVAPTDYQVAMHVVKTDDRWYIADPPDVVLMTASDFSAAFRRRTVYFLDPSGRVVVPDLRYVPASRSADLAANRLMELLLAGPSAALVGAARTQLGPGAGLQSNVRIDDSGVAHVDLQGVDVSTAAARHELAAQIVWTLDPDVQRIAISVNGLPLQSVGRQSGSEEAPDTSSTSDQATYDLARGSVAGFSPDAVPGSAQAVSDAYYLDNGVILKLSDSTPMWGSVGTGSTTVRAASLSAASGALAAVVDSGHGNERLVVGKPFARQPMKTALEADTLTRPSFTRWGYSAWTVQNGSTQPEIYQVSVTGSAPTWSRVSAPGLADIGPVTALALSPDGVRVAIVADGHLYIGVVSPAVADSGDADTDEDRPGGLQQGNLQVMNLTLVRPDLSDVGPVTWKNSVTLFVGAKTATSRHRTVFEVSVDGQSMTALTTSQELGSVFGDVRAIAWSGPDMPMLISYGGRIWELSGSRTSGHWVPPDGQNWMSGTMPFYPK